MSTQKLIEFEMVHANLINKHHPDWSIEDKVRTTIKVVYGNYKSINRSVPSTVARVREYIQEHVA